MKPYSLIAAIITLCMAVILNAPQANAGLDLENQKEIKIEWLDLNLDGRISREEVGEYLFFYLDRDGNESLSRGEYGAERDIVVHAYEGDAINFVDIDHDGQDDGTDFTTESFLAIAMMGEPEDSQIEGTEVLDSGYLKTDTDRSKYVELDEWMKVYKKGASKKGNFAPRAAEQDIYGQ